MEQMKVGSICMVACACIWRLSPLRMSCSMWPFSTCSVSSGTVSARKAFCTWGQ